MESELVLVDREALLAELGRVFDAQTAETLLSVLDKVAAQVSAAGVTRDDFGELKRIVAELAEAQRKAEIRLAGVEDRLSRLEGTVAELAEAQRRTEERVAELAEAQRRTTDTLGNLKGRVLEANYRDKAVAYFGRWLRRPPTAGRTTPSGTRSSCAPASSSPSPATAGPSLRWSPPKTWKPFGGSGLGARREDSRASPAGGTTPRNWFPSSSSRSGWAAALLPPLTDLSWRCSSTQTRSRNSSGPNRTLPICNGCERSPGKTSSPVRCA